ncbi:MAG: HK97 family phage prohead protease [Lachnospiraceae bacterium]|nr:HK97 family phage prohead protease [Lachnospiraceae bacterium]
MKNKEQVVKRMMLTCSDLHVREKEGEESSRTITGYAILFNTPSAPLWSDEESEAREVIDPEAITKEILDGCDIKFTMFHNRQLILARSKNGEGTLSYAVDEKGVSFEFDAPKTVDGDKALELVRRGDLAGCSFMFSTRYYDDACVERTTKVVNKRTLIQYRIKAVTGIYDFTLAADPAYPDTSVEAREFAGLLKKDAIERPDIEKISNQVREMRKVANRNIV